MSYLAAFGAATPGRVVTNHDIAALAGCEPEWITEVSGIEERRWAGEDETVVTMAVQAARQCLHSYGAAPADLGLILVASGSAERRFPGPAASVAHLLGLDSTPAIDLPMASAGALFGLALANTLAPRFGPTLVVAAEKMSSVVLTPPLDKNIAILFGDGAGAALVHPSSGKARILDSQIHSDGAFAQDLKLDFGRPMEMNGRGVIMQAARKVPRVIKDLLARNKVEPQSVSAFLMHQANQNLIRKVAQEVGVPQERFHSIIRTHGNTSSASMLLAAADWDSKSGFQPGQHVVFATFGAGFHWGSMLVQG